MKKRALCVLLVVGVLALSVGLVAAASGSITTMFAFNNGALGNMFDITAAEDITITGFDINIDTPGASNLVLVYYKQGSYVGSETTAGDWTLLGSATVTSNGEDVPTPLAVGGLTIPAGETYGLFITLDYATYVSLMVYTDGANTYSNSEVTLDLGVGTGVPFVDVFSPRTWNGTIYYDYGTEEEATAEPVYERWDPGDARINPQPAMEVAIYCVADGIDLWGFSNLHYGYVSLAEFAAAPATDETPFFTSADGTVRVYHLANGWWGVQKDQVRGDSVETYQFAWDTCAPTMTETTVYDAAGNLLVYEVGP